MKGTIKWFKLIKGYGFIEGEDGKDYFVHHTQLDKKEDIDGLAVEFDADSTDKGDAATNVKFVESTQEVEDTPETEE